jgi:hypothetical protein
MLQAQSAQGFTFSIRNQKLLREVCQDTNTIDTLIDHTVQHSFHALIINLPIGVERGWSDRPDTGIFAHLRTSVK